MQAARIFKSVPLLFRKAGKSFGAFLRRAEAVVFLSDFFRNMPFGVDCEEKRLIFASDATRESVRKAYLSDAPGWSFWSLIPLHIIKYSMKQIIISLLLIATAACAESKNIFVEAELFENKGGWVSDAQFMDQMGSPYLMAHGLGNPVADA